MEFTYSTYNSEMKVIENKLKDEVPFQCIIDRDDILANENFEISDLRIICEVSSSEANFGRNVDGETVLVAFRHVDNEVIKICVKKINSP